MVRRQLRFLVTAAGTREYIDPVRFISNAASGRMGYEIAGAALNAGHRVVLVTAPSAIEPPGGAEIVRAETSRRMFEAVKRRLARCDCLVMAAAVCDYTPLRRSPLKIKKGRDLLILKLKPTADILAWAGAHRKRTQVLVGFALEDRDVRRRAEEKLRRKNLDMIVANGPAAVGARSASVDIKIAGEKWLRMKKTAKAAIAAEIVRLAEARLCCRRQCF
jgi:phosphopantothenoylcysteine decarboxylase/phosphopantothenate--cysteine ligase